MTEEYKVREAAYYVWLNNGCPEGVEIDCWLEAENQGYCDCTAEATACACCGNEPCTCEPTCECKQEGGCCADKKAAKKAPAKKAAAKTTAEKKPAAAKKAPAKKAATKK